MTERPSIVWLRRDLRIGDNAALAAPEGPVISVFILDPVMDQALGAAQRLRLKASLEALARDLRAEGLRLILRRGDALAVLQEIARESGAGAVHWTRLTDGPSLTRDRAVKAALKEDGVTAESHDGFTLLDPWLIKTGAGGPFKVFTPFSRALMARDVPPPLGRPKLRGFTGDVTSDDLADWRLEAPMGPAAEALASSFQAGEGAAHDRLTEWLDGPAPDYAEDRDRLDKADAGTKLSEYLALGEISPRSIWAAMDRAEGARGVEAARRQLVWRDFAHMLLFHDPEMERLCWRREWEGFPWRADNEDAERWRRGETGVEAVDAAMRELWATGRMHNRARMIVASFLTKHLMTDWRVGEAHFRETLIDWDPANNAMGWQWVAGCGPDAAPFFRIFNPERQAETYDPDRAYRRFWLEGRGAETFRAMRPKSWEAPARGQGPVIGLSAGRQRALDAYADMRAGAAQG